MPELRLSLLGPLTITLDGKPFDGIRLRPTLALCIYLASRPERHRREHLITLLWPDWPPASAQQNLRQNLYVLRQALPEIDSHNGGPVPLVLADRDTLQFNPAAAVEVDALRFAALLQRPQPTPLQLAEAIALYRGDFLADFYLSGSEPFEEWAVARRADLLRMMLEALDSLTVGAIERNDYGEAMVYARRQLEIDNLRDSAQRQLMLALARSGQRASALSHYEACRRLLRDELGVEPSSETRALAERIAADEIDLSSIDSIAKHSPVVDNAPPHYNLPLQLSSFIGRKNQLAELITLLTNPDVSLITITGPGGIGKTRLAQEAARRCRTTSYRDGVVFIPLESATTSADMVDRIMVGLGLRGTPSIPHHEAVLNLLQDKHLLLILDTFEHLLPDVQLISRIRERAPEVKVLATSRSALKLSGEHIFVVPSMTDQGQATEFATITQSDAIALFEARARETQPDFVVSADNVAEVVEICRLLGGLPLAIEMAAAHTRTLSLRQLRQQLSIGEGLLIGDLRDTPTRHRSIRETLSWSYALLTPAQQNLFRSFGVFPKGGTLAALKAVAPEVIHNSSEFINSLSGLIDHSMIQTQTVQGRRIYQLHEISSRYAREQLVAHGEFDQTVSRLLDYILELATQVDQHFRDPSRNDWLALFDLEAHLVRQAMEWGLSTDDPPTVTRCLALTGLMLQYWNIRGQHDQARQWTDQALLRGRQLDIDKSALGPALITASSMSLIHTDIQDSLDHAESALQVARETGDRPLEARALHLMGLCAYARAELELAEEIWGEALLLVEQLGIARLLATTLDDLGNLAARRGDYSQALAFHLREQQISLEAIDLYSEFYATINLGEVSMSMERPVDAALYYRRALELSRDLNDSRGLAQTMITQAALMIRLHQPKEALDLLQEVIALAWGIQNLDIVIRGLETLLCSEVIVISPSTRVRFAGAVFHLMDQYASASLPGDKEALSALKERLSREMDPSIFSLEWRIGYTYNWQQAVEMAQKMIEARQATSNTGQES
ncbi:MAG: tetratricopeptide repeat protein [Candidatus Promineofilum sp.]|nr:tetratricopeptide repeat protein [Promineifilum sp.]